MKRIIFIGITGILIALLDPRFATAQGTTTFLSNLEQTPAGSNPVGSDSWLAQQFTTGPNAGGYFVNSVQLGMTDASGSPSGFTVMICANGAEGGFAPGSSLGSLTGSVSPSTGGIYTYNAPLDFNLSPSTVYFIVVTDGKSVASGAYEWGFMNTSSYEPLDSWVGSVTLSSSDGLSGSWTRLGSNPDYDFSEFALLATPVPEPGVLGLFALGALLVGVFRWKARAFK